jgi:hypothetical protein
MFIETLLHYIFFGCSGVRFLVVVHSTTGHYITIGEVIHHTPTRRPVNILTSNVTLPVMNSKTRTWPRNLPYNITSEICPRKHVPICNEHKNTHICEISKLFSRNK